MEEKLQVGVITKPHGIKGAVKIFPTTDDVKRFKPGLDFYLETKKDGMVPVKARTVQFFKQYVIIKFDIFDNPEDAAMYHGCALYVDRDKAVKLKKDEYFISDLEGLPVYCDEPEKYESLGDGLKAKRGINDNGCPDDNAYDHTDEDHRENKQKDVKTGGPDAEKKNEGGTGKAYIGTVSDVLATGANEVIVVKAAGGVFDGIVIEKGKELLFPSIKECVKKIDVDEGMILLHIMPGLL